MISRTAFCSAQPDTMREARIGPIPETSVRRSGAGLDDLEGVHAKGRHDPLGHGRADAAHLTRGEVLLDALHSGRRRGLEHLGLELEPVRAVADPDPAGGDPFACAETAGVWPTTVTRSRLPRAWTFRTAKPFSALWKVTRSTEPARVSRAGR